METSVGAAWDSAPLLPAQEVIVRDAASMIMLMYLFFIITPVLWYETVNRDGSRN